ncbi:MAG: YIP1 family protein [Ignavibacteriales bacterium]|nr:YIP1 family protein [Ignavibacteriales bacterium]
MFSLIISVVFTIALFSNQSLRDQTLEPQRHQVQERVEKGEMTQEQADRAEEFMASSSIMLFTGVVGAIVVVTIAVFGAPLILWLIVKFAFKAPAGYKKILEVYGLSSLIGILSAIVTLIMMHLFDSVRATPGASLLLMSDFDYNSFAHKFIASLNILTIWQTAVFGMGVAKVSNKSLGTGMMVSFGLWLIWVILSASVGLGIG